MTREEFVWGISVAVQEGAVRSAKKDLQSPGAEPSPWRNELATWFNRLPEAEAEMVLRAVNLAVDVSVFGFLCVLDGVRAIERGEDKGEIRLSYIRRDEETRLNGSGDLDLHDIFHKYMHTL
jgi:hypothetical protein